MTNPAFPHLLVPTSARPAAPERDGGCEHCHARTVGLYDPDTEEPHDVTLHQPACPAWTAAVARTGTSGSPTTR